MIKPQYWYIENERRTNENSILHGLNDQSVIRVDFLDLHKSSTFEDILSEIANMRQEDKLDGIIIDLRLDDGGEHMLHFNALSLVQELRYKLQRDPTSMFPMVLITTDTSIKNFVEFVSTWRDLFDYVMYKSEKDDTPWDSIRTKLASLAKGYQVINSVQDTSDYSTYLNTEIPLDYRIVDHLSTIRKSDIATFVLKDLFGYSNPLIDEYVLCARLGVSRESINFETWSELCSKFKPFEYSGIFSEGWKRWWADEVDAFLLHETKVDFSSTPAAERAKILREQFGLSELCEAQPIKFCISTEYWTVCEATKEPIDPMEGYKITHSQYLKPWQEAKVVSLYAILDKRLRDNNLELPSHEKERSNYAKEVLFNE